MKLTDYETTIEVILQTRHSVLLARQMLITYLLHSLPLHILLPW
jgi:hypothetical protein